jgi:hypothetical protein
MYSVRDNSVRDNIIKNFISIKNVILINFEKHMSIFGVRDISTRADPYLYKLFIQDSGLFEDFNDFLSKYTYETARGYDSLEKNVNYQGILIKDKTKNEFLNKKDTEEFAINLIVRTILNEYINQESKINKLSVLLNSGYTTAYDRNLLKKIQETKKELEIIISDLVYYFAIFQDPITKNSEKIYEINEEREKIRNGLLARVSQKDPAVAKEILESRFMTTPTDKMYINTEFVFYHIEYTSAYASLFINNLENKNIDVRSIPIQGDGLNALKNIINNYSLQFNDFEDLYKLVTGKTEYYYSSVIQLYQIIHAYVFITPSLFPSFMKQKKLVEALNKFPYMMEIVQLRKNDYERKHEDDVNKIAQIVNASSKKKKVPIERKVPVRETVLKELKLGKLFTKIDELINKNKLNQYLMRPEIYPTRLETGLYDFFYVTRTIFIFEYARLYDPPREFFIENALFSEESDFLKYSINVPPTYSIYDFVRRRNRCHVFEDLYDTINDNNEQKIQIVNDMLRDIENLELSELTGNMDVILAHYIANVFELYGYVSINQFLLYIEREIKTSLINNLTGKSQVVQIITPKNYIDAIRFTFVNKYDQNLVEPSVRYTSIDEIVVIMRKIQEIMVLFSTNNVIVDNPDEFKNSILSVTQSLKFPNMNFTEEQIIQIKSSILNKMKSTEIEPIPDVEFKQEREADIEFKQEREADIEFKQEREADIEFKQERKGKNSDKIGQELELKSPISKFNYINTTVSKILELTREFKTSVEKIQIELIPIPSNLQLNKEISTLNYDSVPVYDAYNSIISDILAFLPKDTKILGDFGIKLNKFKNKNLSNLSEEDSKNLDALFVRTKNYMDEFVNKTYSFAQDYENIVEYAYKIMSKAFVINYDIKREMFYYDLQDFKLKNNCTAHIDLTNMKYYWGIGNYQIYDPSVDQINQLVVSRYRLNGFDDMLSKYRNQYNYLVGVYYIAKKTKRNRVETLSDVQIGVTGSFNWYRKFKINSEGKSYYDKPENPGDPLQYYVEHPICAAQRELYEESRMFFKLEHIIYEGNKLDDDKLVFSYFVDIKNVEIIDEKSAKQLFSNQERFVPINSVIDQFKNYRKVVGNPGKYYGVRPQSGGVFDNRNLKISVLIAGNDLRDFLKITKSEIRKSNDNIRMVSCVGRDIDIEKYANTKEYDKKVDDIIKNLTGNDKKDYEESNPQSQKLLEEQIRIKQQRIQQRIDDLRQLYQKIRSETDFNDDMSVQYFQSKEIDIEDEIYDLIQHTEVFQPY